MIRFLSNDIKEKDTNLWSYLDSPSWRRRGSWVGLGWRTVIRAASATSSHISTASAFPLYCSHWKGLILTFIPQNLNWSKAYPGQKEIWNYLNTVATKFGVLPHIRFNTKVLRSVWNEKTKAWTVETGTGEIFEGEEPFSRIALTKDPQLPYFWLNLTTHLLIDVIQGILSSQP